LACLETPPQKRHRPTLRGVERADKATIGFGYFLGRKAADSLLGAARKKSPRSDAQASKTPCGCSQGLEGALKVRIARKFIGIDSK